MDIGVYCLNVGQGTCVAVIDPLPGGRDGQFQASLIDVGCDGNRLADWLRSVEVHRIPLIALTHNDEDHVRGLPQLVQRFRLSSARGHPRIGRVLFVIDRDPVDIPFYLDADAWRREGLIEETGRLETPGQYRPSPGGTLIQEPHTSYRLHCAFPSMHQTEAVVRGGSIHGPRLGRDPNDTSAVIRLTRPKNPGRTRFLFGGDLNYPGWQSMREAGLKLRTDVLLAPHHGGPRGETADFGPGELAAETRPRIVLFSAGTRQRGVTPRNEATAKHPLPDVVRAFRDQGATVLCTQITRRCHDAPDTVPRESVIPLPSLTQPHDLHTSGSACAGTILIILRTSGHLTVTRLTDHRTAVDALGPSHHPMCRP
jgi:beta-lactamase superfamily II metal-dependent hydrolase